METKIGRGRLIGGLIVIALGGLFLLDTLDLLDFGDVIGWVASLALILLGLGMLGARKFRQPLFPIVLIIVGALLLLSTIGIDSWRLWPVILIVVGAAILFGGSRRKRRKRERSSRVGSSPENPSPGSFASETPTTSTERELNVSCTLGEANERVETSDFVGGTVNITLGSVNIDLRDATIVNRPATVDVALTMAGLNLRVPSDWIIAVEANVTMGETEDKRPRPDSTGAVADIPHLVIAGNITMGNVVIED